jgi:predicted DNA-binding transcriptional regulator AlpA
MHLTPDLAAALRVLASHGVERGLLALLTQTPGDELSAALDAAPAALPVLLSATQAAILIGASKRTFFRLVERGEMPQPIRFTRKLVRWRLADVVAALAVL